MKKRIKRGWQLTKESGAVLRANPSMLWLAVMSGVCTLFTVAVWAVLFHELDPDWPVALAIFAVVVFTLSLIGGFFGVALAACTARALEGEQDTTPDRLALAAKALGQDDHRLAGVGAAGSVRYGLAVARSRFGVIAQWAAIQTAFGFLLNAVQSVLRQLPGGSVASDVVGGLAGLGWAAASFFVIPILALENVGPLDSLKRSVDTVKKGWGEGAVGSASIGGLAFLLGYLPATLLFFGAVLTMIFSYQRAVGQMLTEGGEPPVMLTVPAVVMMLLAVALAAVTALIHFALTAVFRAALYEYAKTGVASGPFADAELASAFDALPDGYYRPSDFR